MGNHEEPKKAEHEASSVATPPPPQPPPPEVPPVVRNKEAAETHVSEDKCVMPIPQEKASPPAAVKDPALAKSIEGSTNKGFAQIVAEKRLALINAWEESEKTKAESKAYKRMSAVELWENNKRTYVEADLRKIEEKFERKKEEYAEKVKNKVAEIHKAGDEKRAFIEAKQKEQSLKVEETAAKFRDTGYTPRKLLGCFVCQPSAVM